MTSDIDLVIWPEETRRFKLLLVEGQTPGARLPRMLTNSKATHLLGLVTQSRLLGQQNQIVEVAPDGEVVKSRAKNNCCYWVSDRFWALERISCIQGDYRPFSK